MRWVQVCGLLMVLVLLSPGHANGQSNQWGTQPGLVRWTMTRDAGADPSAKAGVVTLCPTAGTGAVLRVVDRNGLPVGVERVWACDGEPHILLFDISARMEPYSILEGKGPMGAEPAWSSPAGLVLETRLRVDGPLDTLDQMREVWRRAPRVYGRSLVPRIFDGIHPHGPSENYIGRYTGCFRVAQAGRYAFATLSENASFLLVDGAPVAEWPGWHDVHGGRLGEHHGIITLTAGQHRIEYWRIQANLNSVAAVAWRPPGRNRFEIMSARDFEPVAAFRVSGIESSPGRKTDAGIVWEMQEHSMVGSNALVTVSLRAVQGTNVTEVRWGFDDGSASTGQEVRHTFLRPAMRTVRVEFWSHAARVANREYDIRVHPRWSQQEEFPAQVYERQKAEIGPRLASPIPLPDLASAVRIAGAVGDTEWLTHLGERVMARSPEFTPEMAETLYQLAFHFQRSEVRRYAMAAEAFERLLGLRPADTNLDARARLHFAGFLVHVSMKPARAAPLLSNLNRGVLGEVDRRLADIYAADARLASGQVQEAAEGYLSIPGTAAPDDRLYTVRRAARLESSHDFLRRREYDDAWKILKEIEWESPVERMGPRTGLPMVEVHMGRQEYPPALARCLMLMNAGVAGENQAWLLLHMVDLYRAMGMANEAKTMLDRLLKSHPHSEPTAIAKDRYGNR